MGVAQTFGLYAVGQKGRIVLEGLGRRPSFVVSYLDKRTDRSDYDSIVEICDGEGIPYFDRKDDFSIDVDLRFFVGWQYLIGGRLEDSVVLHDSYLPYRKGFAPTPTALMLGLPLGATAFEPTDVIDTGPIYARHSIEVEHPMRLEDANKILAEKYVEMIEEVIAGTVIPFLPQERESFSIWRDADDMFLDWDMDAERIQRTVYALGRPFTGAKTRYCGRDIIVHDVEICKEMLFAERHPGKIWQIEDNCPVVVCGSGILKITEATDENGDRVLFEKLRKRMGQ